MGRSSKIKSVKEQTVLFQTYHPRVYPVIVGKMLDEVILERKSVLNFLEKALGISDIGELRDSIHSFQSSIRQQAIDDNTVDSSHHREEYFIFNKRLFLDQCKQIVESRTIERARYYIQRLKKSLTEKRIGNINDIDLNRWQEYDDIITDSLWVLDKRDTSGVHNASYWGNFIPQIPQQLFKRYTKRGDWVLDPFLGSGTTLIECRRQGRNGIGVELQEQVAQQAEQLIKRQGNPYNIHTSVLVGNSTEFDFHDILKKSGIRYVQLLVMHPPYWDILKFSSDKRDLSNSSSLEEFLAMFGKIVDRTFDCLQKGRYFALVIGDKYSAGQWIPLGFYCMQEVLKRKYSLKSIVIKNFDETKGKTNQKKLWRYRALAGGFYIFKHEYIFIFRKE